MKQTTDEQAHAAPLTRKEFMQRWRAYKQKKQAYIESLKEYVRNEYKERTGREPESIEVW